MATDPAQLAKKLDAQYGPGATAKQVDNVYSHYGVPRQSRAEILGVLADVKGFVWRGEVTDRAGRAGVAVTGEDHDQQSVLVFDPKTGVLLAHELVSLTENAGSTRTRCNSPWTAPTSTAKPGNGQG